MSAPAHTSPLDPLAVLRGLASLRKLAGSYPPGHPMITQKLRELDEVIAGLLQSGSPVRIDVIRGDVFLDSVASTNDHVANQQLLSQLSALGIDSIHIDEGVQRDELLAVAEFLWQYTESGDSMASQLAARNVHHVSLGRLLPLDTRWRAQKWADAPTGPLDPDYAESLIIAQQAWENTASGKPLDVVTVRDLVQLLIYKVARSIVNFQREFLDQGIEHLRPLVLRDVANDIGMHESTVSRVVTNKYMHTPQGVFEMKYFFHSGISSSYGDAVSSVTIKNRIKKIIEGEDQRRPLSDSKIMSILQKEGLVLARRTIAKYREELKIPTSNQRKVLY